MLAEISGKGSTCNRRYIQGRTRWLINKCIHRPQPKREAAFDNLKYEVERAPQLAMERSDWRLAYKRILLQRAARASKAQLRQATRDFQKVKKASEEVESLMLAGITMEA